MPITATLRLGLDDRRRCEQCENCLSHVENANCRLSVKNCSHRHIPLLLTCARCKEVRYCSRQCQRLHWKSHKEHCETNRRIAIALDILGPRVERTFKAFVKFCKALGAYLEVPAISALNLRWGKERVNTHVFYIRIRAKETIFKRTHKGTRGCITFKLISAECKTMDEIHEIMDWPGPSCGREKTEKTLAHRPGLLRLYIMDVSGLLPPSLDGYTLPTDISIWPDSFYKTYDPNWMENLLESIGQPLTGPLAGQEDFSSSIFTAGCEEEDWQVPPARPSSPVDKEFNLNEKDILARSSLDLDALSNGLKDEVRNT